MPSEFSVFLLYLFYGMAFFAIGVSITSCDTRASNLKIARFLWLFALFAYSHAFHEWFELYQNLSTAVLPERFEPLAFSLKLLLVLVSFVFLFVFGVRVLLLAFPGKERLLILLSLLASGLFLASVATHLADYSIENYAYINGRIRNLVGFPGAVFSGLGLIFYSRTVSDVSSRGAGNFAGAGVALLMYGILTGIIPSGTTVLGAPIELFRGLSAFIILHFVMHALYVFDEERRLLIEDRLARFAKAEKLHALGKLAFGIAHEINNPLANVSMNVEMLKGHLVSKDDKVLKRFSTIERNLDRASKIARELLSFSTERDAEFVPVSLNDVIQSSLDLLGARRKAYQIHVDLGEVEAISGIPWKLEEVFINLLVNAMDATPEGGDLRVATRQGNKQVLVEIKDNGTGIPAQQLDQVLDPFFTTKDVGQGTGLGLSICYGIMEQHGGRIELSSEPDQGTTVVLVFPQGEPEDGENTGN